MSKDKQANMALRLKMYPWKDWEEWSRAYNYLFSEIAVMAHSLSSDGDKEVDIMKGNEPNIRKAIHLISCWLLRNVGGDSSKFLKMQKLLLIQVLSLKRSMNQIDCNYVTNDDQQLALTYRLIQLVEMGAKTAEYKKSKQGGKLAMKSIAENLGFPTFLVQLRHQAVHEHSILSDEVLSMAIRRLQGYLFSTYWSPIFNKLKKREQQLQNIRMPQNEQNETLSKNGLSNNLHCVLESLDCVRQIVQYLVLVVEALVHLELKLLSKSSKFIHGFPLELLYIFMLPLQLIFDIVSE